MISTEDQTSVCPTWVRVCAAGDLLADGGICVSFDDTQVALFYEAARERVYAVSNYDPVGMAYVLSRGIFGSLGDTRVVASPLYKQHFDLQSGQCIEQPEYALEVYEARIAEGAVQLRKPEPA